MNATVQFNDNSPSAETKKSEQSYRGENKKSDGSKAENQKDPTQDFSDVKLLILTQKATELLPSILHKTILYSARTLIHKVDKLTKHIKNLVEFKNPRRVPKSIRFKFKLTSSAALKGHSRPTTLQDRYHDKIQDTIHYLKEVLQEKEYLEIENA
mmetsp:Transcript_64735/g.76650  ORF Transcript_64735/g.76650 Transcript_64735/m.76650 type:complete len:155 (+) Transcript_64735:104-568(+)